MNLVYCRTGQMQLKTCPPKDEMRSLSPYFRISRISESLLKWIVSGVQGFRGLFGNERDSVAIGAEASYSHVFEAHVSLLAVTA